jgi:hypothetical protein
VWQPLLPLDVGAGGGGVVDVVEHVRVGRQRQRALAPGGDGHGGHLRERAPDQLLEPVLPRTRQEHGEPEQDADGADAVAPAPAHVVLHVHQHGDGEQRADAHEEVEPVEEAQHLLALAVVAVVELVGPEARHARLEPARAERRQVKAQVQHAELGPIGRHAIGARALGVRARRRTKIRRRRRDRQDHHALWIHKKRRVRPITHTIDMLYFFSTAAGVAQATNRGLDGGENADGEVAAEVGVSDESSEEAKHERAADEVCHRVGRGGIAEVHGAGHVRHQVHRDAQRRHPLEQLRTFIRSFIA